MRRWMKRHHFSLSSIAKKDFYPVFAESMENDSAVVQSESSVVSQAFFSQTDMHLVEKLERFSFAFTANVKRQTAGCCLS